MITRTRISCVACGAAPDAGFRFVATVLPAVAFIKVRFVIRYFIPAGPRKFQKPVE